jgi:thioredoxin reductase (NADPH)
MIRNYLGFARGIGGGELAHRAWEQAVLLGAEFAFTDPVTGIEPGGQDLVVTMSNGVAVRARSIIVATGVTYRRLGIPSVEALLGVGVFYGAAGVEAPAMAGEAVAVVGGANSAGQAALYLAKFASTVSILVRGDSLATGMSSYLVEQIHATPNIIVRLETRVADAVGDQRLDGLVVESVKTGETETLAVTAAFIMIGAEPRTEWVGQTLSRDEHGFIFTGSDVPAGERGSSAPALPFETSAPGVFAAGDVRHGSVKRVAGAVGEGSVAVGSVHQYLAALTAHRADAE